MFKNDLGHCNNKFVTDSYGDCTVTYPVRGLVDKSQKLLNLLTTGLADKSHTLLTLSSILGAMSYLVRGLGIRARIC